MPEKTPEEVRAKIVSMRESGLTWEAIHRVYRDIPIEELQEIARGDARLDLRLERAVSSSEDVLQPVFEVHRTISRDGLILWVQSYGVARTGKTTLVRELGALCASHHAHVALVDADVRNRGLFYATAPQQPPPGLSAWQSSLDASEASRRGWVLPGTERGYTQPVDVWAIPEGLNVEDDDLWYERFWRWARATYGLIIVDTGEATPAWANLARTFADQEIVVVPQDPIAINRIRRASEDGHARGAGVVVMGYSERVPEILSPARIAESVGAPLLAAVPYDPQFAHWGFVRSVPWFPMQRGFDESLTAAFEALVPGPWRPKDEEPKRRRWFR